MNTGIVRMLLVHVVLACVLSAVWACGDPDEEIPPDATNASAEQPTPAVNQSAAPPTTQLPTPATSIAATPIPEGVIPTPAGDDLGLLTETYHDDVFSISFKYPAGWYLRGFSHIPATFGDSAGLTSFEPTRDGLGPVSGDLFKLDFNVEQNPGGLTIDQWLGERPDSTMGAIAEAPVVIAGREGLSQSHADDDSISYVYWFPCGTNMCTIAIIWAEPPLDRYVAPILGSVRVE